jgi:catechol 2,3-dioxygenase-like lactoylglutathione lyase family enzyme
VHFVRVSLRAPAERLAPLADFYGAKLGLAWTSSAAGASFQLEETTLEFVAGRGAAFYHFALLVPGDRFDAALAWAQSRVTLLPDPESGKPVFDFDFWDANACYFRDPAENIVELIAHRGIEETGARGAFRAEELVGLSELGLVGDQASMAASLARVELQVWDGTIDPPGGLAFVGERARTLILAPPGRGWLPTGRPAEVHDLEACVSGPPEGTTVLEGSRYRIERSCR